MKPRHPFSLFAPHLALLTFGATALLSWLRHADAMTVVVRSILAFYLAYYCVRLGASVLASLSMRPAAPASDSSTSLGTGPGYPSGSEQS